MKKKGKEKGTRNMSKKNLNIFYLCSDNSKNNSLIIYFLNLEESLLYPQGGGRFVKIPSPPLHTRKVKYIKKSKISCYFDKNVLDL